MAGTTRRGGIAEIRHCPCRRSRRICGTPPSFTPTTVRLAPRCGTGQCPVLQPECASKAVLVPSDPARAASIVGVVPGRERHQWFRSFRSSRSLTRSVFGPIRAFGRLDLLDGVVAECGRPAFPEDGRGASPVLGHQVRSRGEPRHTGVNVWLEAGIGNTVVWPFGDMAGCGRCRPGLGLAPRPPNFPGAWLRFSRQPGHGGAVNLYW